MQSLLQLFKGKSVAWRAHRWAKKDLKRLKPKIAEARNRIQATRVLSDTALFKVVGKRYTFAELWGTIRGNL